MRLAGILFPRSCKRRGKSVSQQTAGGRWLARQQQEAVPEQIPDPKPPEAPKRAPLIFRLNAESIAAVAEWYGISVQELEKRFT